MNADAAAVGSGLLGRAAARAVPAMAASARSLSAVTWAMHVRAHGFPLLRHNVFFSGDYATEFDDIFRRGRLPAGPTVYVCAQDRVDSDGPAVDGPQRLLCLVNAPARADRGGLARTDIEACEARSFALLEGNGLHVERTPEATVVTTPADFERMFPGTGGALYGPASHGWRASFRRPGTRTCIAGLYLAGGSTHPALACRWRRSRDGRRSPA